MTGLLPALVAFQADAPTIQKDKINPAFGRGAKYVSLDAVMDAVRPALNKHGLVWITLPGRDEHGPTLSYRLIHAESGEELAGTMPLLLAKNDPQGFGSALTYARRYSIMAVLGLTADEDDDGNAASRHRNGTPAVLLNEGQRDRVLKAIADAGQSEPLVLRAVGASADAITTVQAKQIREILDHQATS